MFKKDLYIILGVVLLMVGGLFAAYMATSPGGTKTVAANVKFDSKSFTYFYGITCPHCKRVGEWLEKNKVAKKVKFVKREVYYNKENQALMSQAAALCKLDPAQTGVPFLYDNGKCFIGEIEVIERFKKRAGIK